MIAIAAFSTAGLLMLSVTVAVLVWAAIQDGRDQRKATVQQQKGESLALPNR